METIKLRISLINQIKSLIEKLISFFGDYIEFKISLINEIRGLIEKISKFEADFDQNWKKLKFKDQIEKESYCISLIDFPEVVLKIIKIWRVN